MVCETKIVAAEDHEALPGAKKDALLAAAGAMWPPLPAAPGPAAAPSAPPPAPGPQPCGGAGGAEPPGGRGVYIREFRAAEQDAARRIFYDGIMERIPNTAFRGLRQHPRTQLLYALLAGQCAGTPWGTGTRGRAGRSPRIPRAPPAAVLARRPSGDKRSGPSVPLAPPRGRAGAALLSLSGTPLGKEEKPHTPLARTRTRAPTNFRGGPGRGGHQQGGRRGPRARARCGGVGTSAGRGSAPRAGRTRVSTCVPSPAAPPLGAPPGRGEWGRGGGR